MHETIYPRSLENKFHLHPRSSWRKILFALVLVETLVVAVSAAYSPWIVLAFLGLLLGLWFVVTVENAIVYAFLLFLPILPILPSMAHIITLWVLYCLTVAYWYLRWISQGFSYQGLPRYVKSFFFAYLSIGIFSTLNAVRVSISLIELVRYFSLVIILVVLFESIKTKQELKRILHIAILGSALMVLLALPDISSMGLPDLFSTSTVQNRLGSFYGNPNRFAIPFLFSVPALFGRIIYMRPRTKYNVIVKLGLLMLFFLFLYTVLLTYSRSAWLSIFVSLSLLLATSRIGRRLLLGVVALFIFIFPLISSSLFFALRLASGLTGREYLWKAAIQIARENVLLGIGPGNFEFMKPRYILPTHFLSRLMRSPLGSGAAHNLYLTVSAELGLFAAVALVAFLGILLWRAAKLAKNTTDPDLRWLLYTALSVIGGLMIRGFFESGVIIGSGRIGDGIFFLLPVLIIARVDKLVTTARSLRNDGTHQG
jgi:O-antigen ligase